MVVATRRNRSAKGRFWADLGLLKLEVFAVLAVGDVSVLFAHSANLLGAITAGAPMVRIFWYYKWNDFIAYTTIEIFSHVSRPLCPAS